MIVCQFASTHKTIMSRLSVLLMIAGVVLANPTDTAEQPSDVQTTSWHNEPNSRGTWQLLTTCLITINLCVWTAVHLNIPVPIPSPDNRPLKIRIWRNYYCRRARWVLLGLLAPELVVYTAWMQWESARKLVQRSKKWTNPGGEGIQFLVTNQSRA